MLLNQLTPGDVLQDALGHLSVVTRNGDTGVLWLVSVSGYGPADIRATCLDDIHPAAFWMEFRPVKVERFDPHKETLGGK